MGGKSASLKAVKELLARAQTGMSFAGDPVQDWKRAWEPLRDIPAFAEIYREARMVRLFERMGADAIQLEDQDFPKRCGHLDDKSLMTAAEMCGKIRAALDARHAHDTLIIGRTDAVAVEGFERAMERAELYRDAGADVLFVEAPRTRDVGCPWPSPWGISCSWPGRS